MRRIGAVTLVTVMLTVAALGLYAVRWVQVTPREIGRSDFTGNYVAATLWRTGGGARMYDTTAQAALHAHLIAPDIEGNLPSPLLPLGEVIVAPLTFLPLDIAYRIFTALQMLLCAFAALVVVRAAHRDERGGRALAVLPFALPATLVLVILGQMDGINVAGLALFYHLWRRNRPVVAGVVLAASALIAKPHIEVGIAAFLLTWGERKVLLGGVAGGVVTAALTVGAAGRAGVEGWFREVGTLEATPYERLGFRGMASSWIPDGGRAVVVADALSVVALLVCFYAGRQARRNGRAEAGLVAATALSLTLIPHSLMHDQALLAPVLGAWILWGRGRPRNTRMLMLVIVLFIAELVDLGTTAPAPPGRVTPIALVLIATVAVMSMRRDASGARRR